MHHEAAYRCARSLLGPALSAWGLAGRRRLLQALAAQMSLYLAALSAFAVLHASVAQPPPRGCIAKRALMP